MENGWDGDSREANFPKMIASSAQPRAGGMAFLVVLLAYGAVHVVFKETSASALVSAGDSYPSRSPSRNPYNSREMKAARYPQSKI